MPAPLRPLPEHERRAGDSSNECLPPRRPPAGSRCAPARATNAPRVAPTHAAVKRTETRARALLRHAASRPPCPRVDRSKTRRLAGRAFDRPFHTAVLAFPRLSQKYPQTGRSLHEKCSYFCAARDYIFGKTIKNC
ncbi:putative sensor kinase protein [Burkholderia mallei]|nr:putative sensor kinase protein [Burkholderia mallei]